MSPGFKAVLLAAAVTLLLLLAGCASLPEYINASPEERAACAVATTGCTVWTDAEVKAFGTAMFKAGFERGVKHERSSL